MHRWNNFIENSSELVIIVYQNKKFDLFLEIYFCNEKVDDNNFDWNLTSGDEFDLYNELYNTVEFV